jgi:signal transduction histidine kinase/HPt (histidine-containing phosphotransfer) domain-containing protein/ActR/RegA family two-component response regulator
MMDFITPPASVLPPCGRHPAVYRNFGRFLDCCRQLDPFRAKKRPLNPRRSSFGRWLIPALHGLLLVAAILSPVAGAAPAPGFPLVRSYAGTEIGTDAIGFTAIQDARRILYIGSRRAILRYDGETWESLPVPDALTVRGLEFGPDGRLWVAGFGDLGWFEPTAAGPGPFHSLRAFLPEDARSLGEMWHVFADAAGGATFVTADRILRWNGTAFETWIMPEGRRIAAHRVGTQLYFHHLPTGLYTLEPSGPRLIIPASTLGAAAVMWIEARPDHWLFGTSEGFFHYESGQLRPFAPEASAYIKQHRLTRVAILRDGRIAAGTFEGGVALIGREGRLEGVLTEREGLPSRIVRSLYVDHDGQLWVMSTSSISRLDLDSRTRLFDVRAGLPAQPYHVITRHEDRIVVAGERGVFDLPPGHGAFGRSLPAGEVVHDIRGSSDGLLVATSKAALRLSAGDPEVLHETKHDVFAAVPSPTGDDEVFIFDQQQLLSWRQGRRPRILVHDLPDFGRHVAPDRDGNLWIELNALGVMVARPTGDEPGRATVIPAEFGLPARAGSGQAFVRAGPDGTLLLVGEQGGWFKPAGARRFRPIRDWPARPVAAVTEIAADGTLWSVHASTPRLAAVAGRVTLSAGSARWEPFNVAGLATIGVPRSIYHEAGAAPALWIGGSRSVLRHAVAGVPVVEPPRPPLLRVSARAARDSGSQPVLGPLPYSTRAIEFAFAAPQFAGRDSLRLESRIEGMDTDWVPAEASARRELTAVREGRYRFAVRAVAATGAASEPAVFAFEVLPPWWRTAPAAAGALLVLFPLGYACSRLRGCALRRRNLELEARVRQRTEELESANAAKTEFVANMSHDIRNPLNGIVGLTFALEDTRLDRRQQELVATLRDCTTYLSSLVDDVLDFASIEAGRVELRPAPFAPAELLRSIVETLRADATQAGAVVSADAAPDLPPHLQGDAGRIQQILVNFVSNALKYAGGEIRLSAHVPADAPEEVEFAVQDRGPGISLADQAVLFTKFNRLKQDHGTEPIPGTGLGLAACRLLADAMGGAVGVTSAPGQGARFFLRLPLVAATAPALPPADALPRATVLLVEDTQYNAEAATAVLSRLGLTCERATNGEEALRLFAAKHFNVVLLDRNLPDMDGTEVARRMREMEAGGAQAVLLAVTAYCTAQDRALCLAAGMDAFVGKPLTPEKLRRVLAETSRRLLGTPPVHVAPEAKPAGPDFTLLSYLSSTATGGIGEQLRRFLGELDDVQAGLAPAFAGRDFAALANLAHRMLGQARMVEAAALAVAAERLEAVARNRDETGCTAWLPRVSTEAAALRAAVLQRCPAVPSA